LHLPLRMRASATIPLRCSQSRKAAELDPLRRRGTNSSKKSPIRLIALSTLAHRGLLVLRAAKDIATPRKKSSRRICVQRRGIYVQRREVEHRWALLLDGAAPRPSPSVRSSTWRMAAMSACRALATSASAVELCIGDASEKRSAAE
jgi:hypothetical protein